MVDLRRCFLWGMVLIYFALRQGLEDLVYNVFSHNLEYINSIPWRARLWYCGNTLAVLSRTEVLVWILSAVGLIAFWRADRMKSFLFAAGWIIASLVGVSAEWILLPALFSTTASRALPDGGGWRRALCRSRFSGNGFLTWCRKTVLSTTLAVLPLVAIYPFLFCAYAGTSGEADLSWK